MKHGAFFYAIIATGIFLFAAPLWAANPGVSQSGQNVLDFLGQTAQRSGLTTDPNPAAAESPTVLISTIINAILGLLGVVFFMR